MTENHKLEDHLDLITRAARRYVTPMTPLEDLTQEGALLFYSVQDDFDPSRLRSFKVYLWYRCVGRFAYLKHAAYRDAGRTDEIDEVAWALSPQAPNSDCGREARLRVELARTGPDAHKVLGLVFSPPEALHRHLNKEGLRKYMTAHRTLGSSDQYRISAAFDNIREALEAV